MSESIYKFDESSFNKKTEEINAAVKEQAGKQNRNPYLWFRENVQPPT